MITRTASTHSRKTATFGRAVTAALVVILFAAILLFVWLVPLRYAQGWVEVFSEGAAIAAPMAADGIVAIISAAMTAIAVVWLYFRQLAH